MFEGVTYETGARTLAPGDLLALFTDGITEAPAPHGEEFGATRLAELLAPIAGARSTRSSRSCSTPWCSGAAPWTLTTT